MRAQVKAYVIDQLTPLLDAEATTEHPLAVSHGWPGKHLQRNHIWADRITGTVSFDLVMAGRKLRDDQFTIRFVFQASAPGGSLAETDARVEAYCSVFCDLIAVDPSLGDMDGLIHAVFGDSSIEGPTGEFTDEGAVSFMFADLSCHTRT
jgi:hypothetical protein